MTVTPESLRRHELYNYKQHHILFPTLCLASAQITLGNIPSSLGFYSRGSFVFLTFRLQGGQSAPWLLVVTLRHAFPLWQVPQVAGGHRQEP